MALYDTGFQSQDYQKIAKQKYCLKKYEQCQMSWDRKLVVEPMSGIRCKGLEADDIKEI